MAGSKETQFVLDNFGVDSEALTTAHMKRLDRLISHINGAIRFTTTEFWLLHLVGTASQSGSEEYNRDLSRRRAENVQSYLDGRLSGVTKRFKVLGIGESGPEDAKIFENARDRAVGIVARLMGALPRKIKPPKPVKPPKPPKPVDIGILKLRPAAIKDFTLEVTSYLIQSVGIGIGSTPVDLHIARIAMNFTINDGLTTSKYTFMGQGGGSGLSTFVVGGARSISVGKAQTFLAYSSLKSDDFAGEGELSVLSGKFYFGGEERVPGASKRGREFPMGTIEKFRFPPSIPGLPGKEFFDGVITNGFKPLVPQHPAALPKGGIF